MGYRTRAPFSRPPAMHPRRFTRSLVTVATRSDLSNRRSPGQAGMKADVSVLSLAGRCPLLELTESPRSWNPGTFDLSGLQWVTPFDVAGLATLWTRVGGSGADPDVLLPEDDEVRAYLVDIGLNRVIPGDWGLGGGCRVEAPWLPLTWLQSGDEWDDLLQELWPATATAFGDPKLTRNTLELMGELIDNAATHGSSNVGTFVCGQRYTGSTSLLAPGVWIGIADSGVGVPSHLRRNPKYRNIEDDRRLIGMARKPKVTGTTDARGWGLVEAFEDAAEVGPSWVVIRSGRGEGNFRLSQGVPLGARYRSIAPSLPGTWIHVRVGGS